jgi:hypothetical protein
MFRWVKARVKGDRRSLTDKELAEQEAIRREAERERLRSEARRAEERAPLDSHGGGGFGGW